MRPTFVALLTAALLTACGSAPPPAPSAATAAAKPAPKRPARHEVGAAPHGDARIGTFVSDSLTFDTSAYWIEGPDGRGADRHRVLVIGRR
jgi:hypothetical protein